MEESREETEGTTGFIYEIMLEESLKTISEVILGRIQKKSLKESRDKSIKQSWRKPIKDTREIHSTILGTSPKSNPGKNSIKNLWKNSGVNPWKSHGKPVRNPQKSRRKESRE